ncbi:fimbrial protein [Providencia sp. Me31A]|uniref:fimbrial protein n=1 Tax=Providencia sp. Me31A TaxID=3392637 RepID=UPI003D26959A
MNKKRVNISLIVMILTITISLLLNSKIATADTNVVVNMKGRLLDFPPCEVYGLQGKGNPIHIDFGEIGIQRIDGQRYRQDWTLKIACDAGLGRDVPIALTYTSGRSSFDNLAIATNKTNLGIRVYPVNTSGEPIKINTPMTIRMSSNGYKEIPLYSVPVKRSGGNLTAGKFSATATVTITYP